MIDSWVTNIKPPTPSARGTITQHGRMTTAAKRQEYKPSEIDSHSARTKMEPQSVQSTEKRRFGGPNGGFLDPFLCLRGKVRRDEGEKNGCCTTVVRQRRRPIGNQYSSRNRGS